MNLTDKFLLPIIELSYNEIDRDTEFFIRERLLDTIGVTIAGAKSLGKKIDILSNLLSSNPYGIKPIGSDKKFSIENAIFINGINSHYLELDDGIRFGASHPSAPLFSAFIPLMQYVKIDWDNFIKGCVCGYETCIRLAYAMQPSHYKRGFHPTATTGAPGVAVGVAVMRRWDYEIIKDSFSSACTSAFGTLKVIEDNSEIKPLNVGKTALMGYLSAISAKAGFKSPDDSLNGDTGFLKMFSDNFNPEILFNSSDRLFLKSIYNKPYASCRHTHPVIEACLNLRQNPSLDLNKINQINVRTYDTIIGKHDSKDIKNTSSAKMSIPYCAAVALKEGKAYVSQFDISCINDEVIKDLISKTTVLGSQELTKFLPHKRIAEVEIILEDNSRYIDKIEYPKGEPENPLSEKENHDKFMSLAIEGGLSINKANEIYNEIMFKSKPDLSVLW